MSTFVQVRFYNSKGEYAICWLQIDSDNLKVVAQILEGIKTGWEIGWDSGKGSFFWDSIRTTCPTGGGVYKVPDEKLGLAMFLKGLLNARDSSQDQRKA